jgi:hypothetical protein
LCHEIFFLGGDHAVRTQRKQFSLLRVVAIAIAPSAFAISMAAMPTLLDAAVINTKSPLPNLAVAINAP